MILFNKNFFKKLITFMPILILFYLSFKNISFSIKEYYFLSSNFTHILIFYCVLRKPEVLPYGLIFIAGFINDVVMGMPIGISSVTYLILSGFAAYIRYLIVRPSIRSDWIAYLPSILITNSIYFLILVFYFEIEINYLNLILNTLLTILLYPLIGGVFSIIFGFISKKYVY